MICISIGFPDYFKTLFIHIHQHLNFISSEKKKYTLLPNRFSHLTFNFKVRSPHLNTVTRIFVITDKIRLSCCRMAAFRDWIRLMPINLKLLSSKLVWRVLFTIFLVTCTIRRHIQHRVLFYIQQSWSW